MTMSKGEISRMAQAPLHPVPDGATAASPPEKHPNLYAALAKAQGEMPPAIFNRINPHYKSKYADLSALREATLPILSKYGLCIIQYTSVDPVTGAVLLWTRLGHESGDFIEGAYPIPNAPDKPQVMGSAQTYGRRYGWGGIVGEASEEDDDGNAAHGAAKNGRQTTYERTGVKSSHQAKKDGDWETMLASLNNTQDMDDLRKFATNNRAAIEALPDNWKTHLREAYEARKIMLTEGVDENGQLTTTQKLKASVAAEENQEF